ncbi:MEKK [Handroanthus impetiginosus]|uniref:MEKK n=1 Tax=Handroanthus impetiginosus TaxID=429701 RepID=A0A2G9HFD4_9LAMI|nr:MEKK [Handroanthus impetiginosus]
MRFPRDKDQYVLGAAIGGGTAVGSIYAAKHVNPETGNEVPVGIKIVNINKIEDIYTFTQEIHVAETCDHENMVKIHCSFKVNNQLWLVMSPLSGFSLRSIIRSSFPNGLPQNSVSFILKETLKVVHYLHENNKPHQSLGADCIFLDEKSSTVKLLLYSLSFENSKPDSYGFPDWTLAPEVKNDYRKGSDKATDIWMFGLLALELFYGQFPASDFEEFHFLLNGIEDEFGASKKKESDGKIKGSGFFGKFSVFSCFSKQPKKIIPRPLGEVVAACLARDPKKRPTTNQLMEFNLFKKPSVGQESLAKLKKQCKGIISEEN